jgi:hypothetical protein
MCSVTASAPSTALLRRAVPSPASAVAEGSARTSMRDVEAGGDLHPQGVFAG